MSATARRTARAASLVGLLLALGCAGETVRVAPQPRTPYRVIGTVRGSGCGFMLWDFIPIGVNGRVEEAYRAALARAPGATALIDVELRDRWYTAGGIMIAGHGVCTDIQGTAIEEPTR